MTESMTAEEFVVWAEKHPEKHWELFDGAAQLQQPQNWGHAQHVLALSRLLDDAIKASGLNLFIGTRGIMVKAGPNRAFEPDVVVFPGPMNDRDIIVPEPVIVVEVLSPSTEVKDLTVKLAGYLNVPSVEHYVILDWEKRTVIQHSRGDGGMLATRIAGIGDRLTFDPPGISIAVSDLFGDLDSSFADE
jgi:Uma2 family endonuclease